MTSSSPKLPDSVDEIHVELNKQESLLNQIHAEMNAGFVSKKREEQLWEVQRIITQLKRKLRVLEKKVDKSMEKSMEKSLDEGVEVNNDSLKSSSGVLNQQTADTDVEDDDHEEGRSPHGSANAINANLNKTAHRSPEQCASSAQARDEIVSTSELKGDLFAEGLYLDESTGLLMLPKSHPDYYTLIQLQLENHELLLWKKQLQDRITAERTEIFSLKQKLQQVEKLINPNSNGEVDSSDSTDVALLKDATHLESLIDHYLRENAVLEQRKLFLSKEILEETKQCIALEVELAMQQF